MHAHFVVAASAIAVGILTAGTARGQYTPIFEYRSDSGFFQAWSPTSTSQDVYSDSGYLGTGNPALSATNISLITLKLAANNGSASAIPAGTVDLNFKFARGDPSGLYFGNPTPIYSTTITGVSLPALAANSSEFFTVDVPLPDLSLNGASDSFLNFGYSLSPNNYAYQGGLGFQLSSVFAWTNYPPYTSQHSPNYYYSSNGGSSWSAFAFNLPGGTIGQFATVLWVPEPASIGAVAGTLVLALRRRR